MPIRRDEKTKRERSTPSGVPAKVTWGGLGARHLTRSQPPPRTLWTLPPDFILFYFLYAFWFFPVFLRFWTPPKIGVLVKNIFSFHERHRFTYHRGKDFLLREARIYFSWRHGFTSRGGANLLSREARSYLTEKEKRVFSFARGTDLLLVEAWICFRERHNKR